MNRRSFFQITLASAAAIVGYSMLANAEERRRGGTPPADGAAGKLSFMDPNDPGAKAVNYVALNSNMKDAKLQTERSGVKFKDQHCKGCTFYQKDKEASIGGKKGAPCQMPFAAGKAVSAEGWCTSWAKRA